MIGLDSMSPELAFAEWAQELPNISSLKNRGIYGPLKSCDPPITVPAWASMMSSKNPGRLGLYGFRNRTDYSYENLAIANSLSVKEDRVWDILSRMGRESILIGVPQTYPPRPLNGCMVTCFLTPSTQNQYTYPADLRNEVEATVGEYLLDVRNFRSDNKDDILKEIYDMTERRFKLARHWLKTRPWDFFMMVEMGVDRIHHGFWKYMDPLHRKYAKGNPYENAIRDYYRYVDRQIGETLSLIDTDTVVFIVSDHGAKRMEGGICINEWFRLNGYLSLLEDPQELIPFSKAKIDWSKTKSWGEGGYYSRIFLNVKGREPQGVIDPKDYERMRDEVIASLEAIPDEKGKPLGTRAYRPEEIYPEVRGIPPDLIVYFGNLSWRSVGSIGYGAIHTFDNDTGPDDANHSEYGVFLMADLRNKDGGLERRDLHLLDVAPTILAAMGLPVPPDMEGKIISTKTV